MASHLSHTTQSPDLVDWHLATVTMALPQHLHHMEMVDSSWDDETFGHLVNHEFIGYSDIQP